VREQRKNKKPLQRKEVTERDAKVRAKQQQPKRKEMKEKEKIGDTK